MLKVRAYREGVSTNSGYLLLLRCGWSVPGDENASLNIVQRSVEVSPISHAAERNTLLAV